MQTNKEFLMDLWRDMCGLPEKGLIGNHPNLETLKRNQWSKEFETLMRSQFNLAYARNAKWEESMITLMKNRMVMGSFRYGLIANQDYSRFNLMGYIEDKLRKFDMWYGDLEAIIDAANNCMLAFIHSHRLGVKQVKSLPFGFSIFNLAQSCINEYKKTNNPWLMGELAAEFMYMYHKGIRGCGMKLIPVDDGEHGKEIL